MKVQELSKEQSSSKVKKKKNAIYQNNSYFLTQILFVTYAKRT